jgi:hypothetical protein
VFVLTLLWLSRHNKDLTVIDYVLIMGMAIKFLLVLECVIAFFAVTALWLMAVPMLPISLMLMVTEGGDSYVLVALTLLGGLGLCGVLQLLLAILLPAKVRIQWRYMIFYIVSGVTALAIAGLTMPVSNLYHVLIFLMPILVTLHFCYLARAITTQYLQKELHKTNEMVQ